MAMRAPDGFAPRTVFIGGGTPTILTADELRRLAAILGAHCDLSRVEEWTVEANPGTLDTERIDALLECGVNRVSMGVQSFDDGILKSVGRIHDADTARQAVRDLRDAGVPHISVDLLFALPGQGIDTFRSDLDEAVELGTGHLSCYALLYEEGTTMTAREKRGLVKREEDENERTMLLMARARLRDAGFEAYEISNFARPGEECLHNLVYWRNDPYLGVGVSAASYDGAERRSNVRDLHAYIERLSKDEDPVAERETLGAEAVLGETVMLQLRTPEGVSVDALSERTGLDARALHGERIERLADRGLLEFDGDVFRLTDDGLCVSDTIALEFMAEVSA
jgi:oxygen-independent coproporphyrinogen-3 oxidase